MPDEITYVVRCCCKKTFKSLKIPNRFVFFATLLPMDGIQTYESGEYKMNMILNPKSVWLGLVTSVLFTTPVLAEIGKTNAEAGEVYFTLDESVIRAEGREHQTHGLPTGRREADPKHGVNIRGSLGVVLDDEVLGLMNPRVEAGLMYGKFISDSVIAPSGSGMRTPDGVGAVFLLGNSGSLHEFDFFDGQVSFKGDLPMGDNLSVTLGISPFYRDEQASASLLANTFRHEVGIQSFGLMVNVQPEWAFSDQFSLVADLSGGIYYSSVDAQFSSLFGGPVFASDDFVGFRGRGLVGLKMAITEDTSFTFFGGAEYWSDTAVGERSPGAGIPSFIRKDSLFELMGGLSINVALGQY